jgi:hypothetical protein
VFHIPVKLKRLCLILIAIFVVMLQVPSFRNEAILYPQRTAIAIQLQMRLNAGTKLSQSEVRQMSDSHALLRGFTVTTSMTPVKQKGAAIGNTFMLCVSIIIFCVLGMLALFGAALLSWPGISIALIFAFACFVRMIFVPEEKRVARPVMTNRSVRIALDSRDGTGADLQAALRDNPDDEELQNLRTRLARIGNDSDVQKRQAEVTRLKAKVLADEKAALLGSIDRSLEEIKFRLDSAEEEQE